MEFLIFILVVSIVFGIQAFIAAQFSVIAEEKGYPEAKYFWFCVFLGIVGYLMVVALPDKNLAKAVSKTEQKNSPENYSVKNVSNSGFSLNFSNVPYGQKGTRYDRSDMNASSWVCTSCGRTNAEYTGTCACGNSKSAN